MFAIISMSQPPEPRSIFKQLFKSTKKPQIIPHRIGMTYFYTALLPKSNNAEAQCLKLLKQLKDTGVRSVHLPSELRHIAESLQLAQLNKKAAVSALTVPAVIKTAAQLGCPPHALCVQICAQNSTNYTAIASLLAPMVRALRFDPPPGEALAQGLLSTYGIASSGPPPKDTKTLKLWLSGQCPQGGSILNLTGEHEQENAFRPSFTARGRAEQFAQHEQSELIFSALVANGAISAHDLRITKILPPPIFIQN